MKEDAPSIDLLSNLELGVWKATVLKAGLELDVFTAISIGNHTLKDVVEATECDERGLRILLDALCPLGLLSKSKGEYFLTPTSEAFLVRGKETYHGDWLLQAGLAWEARAKIAEGIKTGRPVGLDASGPSADHLWASDYAPHILVWLQSAERFKAMWETLKVSPETMPGLRILDVGCGSGIKSFTLAQADADARVTAMDLNQKVLEIAAKVAEEMGVGKQVAFKRGDILEADLGAGQYDIVLFGLILHYFQPDQVRDILRRTYQALKPGGMIVINTYIADKERCRAEMALIAALQLFMFAPGSEVYTFSEYTGLGEGRLQEHHPAQRFRHICQETRLTALVSPVPGPSPAGFPETFFRTRLEIGPDNRQGLGHLVGYSLTKDLIPIPMLRLEA
jgi:2-polyprenyl-3-methyl-5-hydroxy-6-metoxy-1,4-benzoquinol methylase